MDNEFGRGPTSMQRGRLERPGPQTEVLAVGVTRAYDCSMLDWSQCPAVERVQGKVGGAWLFRGTRVPVIALFENIEGGARVDEFLEWFPGVTRQQVEQVLAHMERSLSAA